MKKYIGFGLAFITFITLSPVASAATLYSESIELASGWNIVSTPRLLDSHAFSATENSANFDIYLLDASQTSGWATMAQEGQTEFTPLHGYFINNKTGTGQTLTFNYKADTQPNERLFERTFTTAGWYSIGVANPTYAKFRTESSATDINNPNDVLFSMRNHYSQIVDFTFDAFDSDPDSVAVGDTWSAYTYSDGNSTKDFRETKAYAVYINEIDASYSGFQNDSVAACRDGVDNDSDGDTDLDDAGCDNVNDNDEENTIGSVALSIASSPAAQTIVAGTAGISVSGVVFNATQSSENVRFTSIKFYYQEANLGTGEDPTNCFAYDGSTRLNSTAVNPTTNNTDHTFTLDTTLTVTNGTSKTILIKCDIPSGAIGTFNWGLNGSGLNATFTGTGVSSAQTITPTIATSGGVPGNTQTIIADGTLTVALDSSSPAYALAAAGSTNVTLGTLRFNGTNEAMRLERVALQMSNTFASSSPTDITEITLWDGATQVGTASFTDTNRYATSTLSGTVIIPSNGSKTLTVKGDLALQGTGEAGTPGVLIQVDYDDDDSTGTRAIGQSSGSTMNRTSSADTVVDGVRVFRSLPTVAKIAVPSTSLTSGTMDLYRFSVSADAKGDVSLYQIVANIATSTGSAANGTTTLTNFKVYAYTNSDFTSPVSGFTDGQIVSTLTSGVVANGDTELQLSAILTIPAGATRYFKLVADVTGTNGTTNWSGSISTKITGDAAYPSLANLMASASSIDPDGNNDFIWSPNSTSTTPAFANNDWTNGFGVAGLSSGGTDTTTLFR